MIRLAFKIQTFHLKLNKHTKVILLLFPFFYNYYIVIISSDFFTIIILLFLTQKSENFSTRGAKKPAKKVTITSSNQNKRETKMRLKQPRYKIIHKQAKELSYHM